MLRAEPWSGQAVDIDMFWAEAWSELQARQAYLAGACRLAGAEWRVDQAQGLITFVRPEGSRARASVQILGSWSPRTHLFAWAWDHPSVHTRLRAFAERTRWFGEKHELLELTAPRLTLSEVEVWRLSAVALKVNAARAAYRGPADEDGGPVVFMAIGDLSEEG